MNPGQKSGSQWPLMLAKTLKVLVEQAVLMQLFKERLLTKTCAVSFLSGRGIDDNLT